MTLPENRFFIRGNAAGVEAALRGPKRPDALVFVNNDMTVEPSFLAELLAGFDGPDVFATTARILMDPPLETGLTRAEYRRGAIHQVQIEPGDARAIPALWAGGGSSAFDTEKFLALGGFETLFEPCYSEDQSLSYRAWRRGWRVHYRPTAIAHHAHRATSTRVFGRRGVERLSRRNRELFFWRAITDRGMVFEHGLLLGWNAYKDARRLTTVERPLLLQLAAILRALPRLPAALGARQTLRAVSRRPDRAVLALASDVHLYAAVTGAARPSPPRVLSLGDPAAAPWRTTSDAIRIVHHAVDLAATPGALRDRLRWLLFENEYAAVRVRDPDLADAVRRIRPEAMILIEPPPATDGPTPADDESDVCSDAEAASLAERLASRPGLAATLQMMRAPTTAAPRAATGQGPNQAPPPETGP